MAFTKKNDEAVSPVIGVILMVAVTVILAAVIAAFVFGMAGNLQKGKVVAFTAVRPSSGTITISNMGGQDVGSLSNVAYTIDSGNPNVLSATSLGSSYDITNVAAGSHRVVVMGQFVDGTTQILLDTRV